MCRQPDAHPKWSSLLASAQDGDRAAYAEFLNAVIPVLREGACRTTADPAHAERIVQAALVSIHRLRHTYDPRRPVDPWLAGILTAETRRALKAGAPGRLHPFARTPKWSPFPVQKLRAA